MTVRAAPVSQLVGRIQVECYSSGNASPEGDEARVRAKKIV